MDFKLSLAITLVIFLSANVLSASVVSYYFETSSGNDSTITLSEIIRSSSVSLQITTDKPTTCKYSDLKGVPYSAMPGTFDLNFETVHKKTLTELFDGVYKYYVKCKDNFNNESGELEAIFAVSVPVSANIILPEGSPAKAGKTEVNLITSKIVSQTPSLSYSFDGVSYNPLPLSGSGTSWTGYLIIPDSLKEEVGSFKFQGRDLEGTLGTEITSGGIFIVDALKPKTIIDIKAEGYEGKIDLNWHFENLEEIKEFKIYRSTTPGLNHADYYATTDKNSFSDTSVEKGKTYYYKVSAIDEAGNEGELSLEVYATALLENITISTSGLEARFLGIVDNLLQEIDSISESARIAKENFEEKNEKEKTIYSDLKLSREINSAESELNSLRKEITNFKSQSLTRNELDRKLNSGKLKLNTIKKKIPENIIIISEKKESGEVSEEDITQVLLELTPDITEKDTKKNLKKSIDSMTANNFKVSREGYNLEIVYLDGTRKEKLLIKEKIESSLKQNENISILEVIPESIVDNVLNIDIKNINYDILKENAIISFDSDTKEIVYSRDGHADLNYLNKIKTLILHETTEKEKSSIFTGYSSLSNVGNPKNFWGIFLGIFFISFLFGYLRLIKQKREIIEKVSPVKKQILEAEERIADGRLEMASEIYNALSKEYKTLNKKEKKAIYAELENLHKKINNPKIEKK